MWFSTICLLFCINYCICDEEKNVFHLKNGTAPAAQITSLKNVCFYSNRKGRSRRPESIASLCHGTIGASRDDHQRPCYELSRCSKPRTFEACRAVGSNASSLEFAQWYGWCSTEDEPAQSFEKTERVNSIAHIYLTGNIGHDAFNSWVDAYAQQHLLGRPFDVIIVEVVWFDGWSSWHRAVKNVHITWSMTVLRALFDSPNTQFLYVATEDSPTYRGSPQNTILNDLEGRRICSDYSYIQLGTMAMNIGWPNLKLVSEFREQIMRAMNVSDQPFADREIILYTRSDARRRRLRFNDLDMLTRAKEAWNITRVVEHMPLSPTDQIRLFATADVFIAPHGAASMNSIFLKRHATYVELSPVCVESCLQGCFPYSSTGSFFSRGDTLMNLISTKPQQSCSMILQMYGVLHESTGVRYHAIPLCVGGNRCYNHTINNQSLIGRYKKMWKYNYQSDILMKDDLIERVADILRGSDRTNEVAPFQTRC